MSEAWYDIHWKKKETANFNVWWVEFYGKPVDYPVDVDEYWIRKAFALAGWIARGIKR